MAITNGYATLSQIKTYLSTASTNDDARLENAIEAASRAIDAETRRVFFSTTATKYFQAESTEYLCLDDDLLSVTTLAVDDNYRNYRTLASTDFELETTSPFQEIYIAPASSASFPTSRRGVRIAGSWGYCATGSHPDAINNACLILAVRYFKRRDAAFGVIGTPELGYTRITAKDPEVRGLLGPYKSVHVNAV
jgi:uncharacterized phiE125 gp8 family phage protein